jgi:large subunit ribosomal protein L32
MSVRMRHTRAHTGNRRSHHGLSEPRLSKCSHCGELHVSHHVCKECGSYRGRIVIDVTKEVQKKKKREEGKQASREEEVKQAEESVAPGEEKPLNPEDLSKK